MLTRFNLYKVLAPNDLVFMDFKLTPFLLFYNLSSINSQMYKIKSREKKSREINLL